MEDYLNIIATILLIFSKPYTIFSFFLLGFFFYEKNTWGVAAFLACFSMILNPALKEFFQVPLPNGLSGYGFPSGHFQAAMCFYGWIFMRTPQIWVRTAIVSILLGDAFALIQKGYHYPYDVTGAFIVGGLVVLFANFMLKRAPFKTNPEKLGFLMLGLSCLPLSYLLWRQHVQMHTIQGLSILVIFTWLWNRSTKKLAICV